jgi:hypothetical protein
MHTSNGNVGERHLSGDGTAGNYSRRAGNEGKRLVIEPDAACQLHSVRDHAEADTPIVVAADCPDEALSASGGNQLGQLRQSALFVNKIAAEQEQIGVRGCDDPLQLVAKTFGFSLSKMQIAHV